jgi:hypothetical protein
VWISSLLGREFPGFLVLLVGLLMVCIAGIGESRAGRTSFALRPRPRGFVGRFADNPVGLSTVTVLLRSRASPIRPEQLEHL